MWFLHVSLRDKEPGGGECGEIWWVRIKNELRIRK
jgi:hypothetical protein